MQRRQTWRLFVFVLMHLIRNQERCCAALAGPRLSDERFVFQTDFGDIEMALYPDVRASENIHLRSHAESPAGLPVQVAPVTTAHMLKLIKLGGFNGNHFFRVDKGFVAQTADVLGGRPAPLDKRQQVLLSCLILSRQ